jgi:hypothetical protein
MGKGGGIMKTFIVSVSRMAKGKEGYKQNKYRFGWSFYPEQHTIESLIKLAAVEGYSFLAGEFARESPAHYGREDVNTARITENFRQTYIIPLDDDGKESEAVEFWENDLLFKTFGGGYYHSASSTIEQPRIRPIFELDTPITDSGLYQEIRHAFGWYYNQDGAKRIDVLPQIPQVWYGSPHPTNYRILAGVLPIQAIQQLILDPYRQVVTAQREARRREIDQYQRQNRDKGDGGGILLWLARRQPGDNRNLCLLWASSQLKKLGETWATVGNDLIAACRANGYFDAYAHSDREIQRVFGKGKAL